jgi:hypothetical protein
MYHKDMMIGEEGEEGEENHQVLEWWGNICNKIQKSINVNFWGNLTIFKSAFMNNDLYARRLQRGMALSS